jgi:hypothetical protein
LLSGGIAFIGGDQDHLLAVIRERIIDRFNSDGFRFRYSPPW